MDMNIETSGSCEEIREQFTMLLYGELSFDEEERVEVHLEACADCLDALGAERELLAAIDQVAVEPSPALLRQCRENFAARLESERSLAQGREAQAGSATAVRDGVESQGFWSRLADLLGLRNAGETPELNWARPAGAVALIAVGFFSAQVAPSILPGFGNGVGGFSGAGLVNANAAQVRSVERAPNGVLRIVVDETRQRELVGGLEDDMIRALLLAASTDPSNMMRAETVAILSAKPQTDGVRDTLIYALRNDDNVGVRLKALEGLESFSEARDVQDALAEVLLTDENPGVRQQAIDILLTGLSQNSDQTLDRSMIGKLQQAMVSEDNPYVRQRCQLALEQANASAEVF